MKLLAVIFAWAVFLACVWHPLVRMLSRGDTTITVGLYLFLFLVLAFVGKRR